MKKLLSLFLTVMLILSLAACGGGQGETPSGPSGDTPGTPTPSQQQEPTPSQQPPENTPDTSEDPEVTDPGTIPEIDIDAILGGNEAANTIWGLQDQATKDAMIAEGKADGYDVSFADDGSTTIVDTETGEVVIQNPDGTWTIQGEDGSLGQYGGDWPENEFTKLLPKPDMEILVSAVNEWEFTVSFKDATLDQMKAYAEKVKSYGFTIDAELTDQVIGEMVIYSYTASNADGYEVTVSCTMGITALLITKP